MESLTNLHHNHSLAFLFFRFLGWISRIITKSTTQDPITSNATSSAAIRKVACWSVPKFPHRWCMQRMAHLGSATARLCHSLIIRRRTSRVWIGISTIRDVTPAKRIRSREPLTSTTSGLLGWPFFRWGKWHDFLLLVESDWPRSVKIQVFWLVLTEFCTRID